MPRSPRPALLAAALALTASVGTGAVAIAAAGHGGSPAAVPVPKAAAATTGALTAPVSGTTPATRAGAAAAPRGRGVTPSTRRVTSSPTAGGSGGACPAVQLLWARASNEKPGQDYLGGTGATFARAIRARLGTRTFAATGVRYAAAGDQSSAAPGGTAMTTQFEALAARCPATRFVLGGGSQGATVTDIALGARTSYGSARSIPASLAPRVSAVVVFGNPVRKRNGSLRVLTPSYADRTMDLCAQGDPICDPRGTDPTGHYSYLWNGAIDTGAAFAAGCVTSRCTGASDAVPLRG